MIEGDVFRINIPLDKVAAEEASEQKTLSEREQKIYNMICENLHLTIEQVMAEFDISRATVFRDYAKIKQVTGDDVRLVSRKCKIYYYRIICAWLRDLQPATLLKSRKLFQKAS